MMNVSDLEDRGDTNDSSEGAPGDVMEGRATMVPPTSLSTYVSLNSILWSTCQSLRTFSEIFRMIRISSSSVIEV